MLDERIGEGELPRLRELEDRDRGEHLRTRGHPEPRVARHGDVPGGVGHALHEAKRLLPPAAHDGDPGEGLLRLEPRLQPVEPPAGLGRRERCVRRLDRLDRDRPEHELEPVGVRGGDPELVLLPRPALRVLAVHEDERSTAQDLDRVPLDRPELRLRFEHPLRETARAALAGNARLEVIAGERLERRPVVRVQGGDKGLGALAQECLDRLRRGPGARRGDQDQGSQTGATAHEGSFPRAGSPGD
jgi:hypothetical protein